MTEGFKKTGDPDVEVTAKIYRVAPQILGERPLKEGDQERIDEIIALRKSGKLNETHLKLLDRMALFAATDFDEF